MITFFDFQLSQQLSGVNGVIFFAEKIFMMAGAEDPVMCTIIVGVVQSIATLVSSVLVDRAGRKFLLILSGVGMAIFLVALGYFFIILESKGDVTNLKWLPLVSVVGYIVVFSLGFGPLPWMMAGELLPPQIKGFGSGITVAVNWTSVSVVTLFFQPLVKLISSGYMFSMFAVISVIATLFIIFFVPETKGKSMQEIQDELAGIKSSTTSVETESSLFNDFEN